MDEINLTIKYSIGFIIIIGLIGMGQYFKFDIFHYDWGKLILAPKDKVDDLVFKSQLGRVYMTLYNPNYVGTYFVLIGPLIANLFINAKKRVADIFYLVLYFTLVFSLAGSQSRGGFLGAVVSLIIIFVLNFTYNNKTDVLRKRVKSAVIIVVFILIFFNHGNNIERVNTMFDDTNDKISLQNIYTFDEQIYIEYNQQEYFIMEENNSFVMYEGSLVDYSSEKIVLHEKLSIMPSWISIKGVYMEEGDHTFIVTIEDTLKLPFANTEKGMKYINRKAYYSNLEKIPAVNVYQRESMGSGRVYIWSRSIPLLKETLLIGKGADTYPLVFPQTDYIGKFKGFGDYKRLNETIVDKPHNLYLQIGINIGVVSLIVYLSINIFIVFDLFSLTKKRNYSDKAIPFISIIIGYSITMLFNDSTVVVSTVYWVTIGLSMALIKLDKKTNSINFFFYK
jgi:hypothetical protein